MEEINLVNEIERLESMYNHYRTLYHRLFLCCSSESKRLKEQNFFFKIHLEEAKRIKEHSDAVKSHLILPTTAKHLN